MDYKTLIIEMVQQMDNVDYLRKIYHFILAKFRREKGNTFTQK